MEEAGTLMAAVTAADTVVAAVVVTVQVAVDTPAAVAIPEPVAAVAERRAQAAVAARLGRPNSPEQGVGHLVHTHYDYRHVISLFG